MERRFTEPEGDRWLNKHKKYNQFTPKSKGHIKTMVEKVLSTWILEGRATTISELRAVIKTRRLCYLQKFRKKPKKTAYPITVLKEFLPYIPVRTVEFFSKGKTRTGGNPAIADEAMHKNLRKVFPKTKTKYTRISSSRSKSKAAEILNKRENAKTLEVVFFPSFAIKDVSTEEFKKRLLNEKVSPKKLDEWFLGKDPEKSEEARWVALWEAEQVALWEQGKAYRLRTKRFH